MKKIFNLFFFILFVTCFSSVLSQDRIVISPDHTYSEIRTKRASLSLLINKVDDLLFNGEVFIDFGINPDHLVSESDGIVFPIGYLNEKNYFFKRHNLDPGQTYHNICRLESGYISSVFRRSFNNKNLI